MRTVRRSLFASFALLGSLAALATAAVPAASADPAPAGSFAIGDGNAATGTAVTFWGARWWKDNQLSAGTAPPSFKGYALTVDSTSCTFTSTTGNSPPPPSGPLPALITVLVTSSVSQSGPTISGTVTGFALVATDPGYDSDPGHAGTGTVVGFFPCGGGF